MLTNVVDAIENQVNKKSDFEKHQSKRLEVLLEILVSENKSDLDKERKSIIKKLKAAGILDGNSALSKNYRG